MEDKARRRKKGKSSNAGVFVCYWHQERRKKNRREKFHFSFSRPFHFSHHSCLPLELCLFVFFGSISKEKTSRSLLYISENKKTRKIRKKGWLLFCPFWDGEKLVDEITKT